jgi:hypothetical protein
VVINAISLLPVLGGVPKMVRALRSIAQRGIKEAGQIYGAATTVGHSLLEE